MIAADLRRSSLPGKCNEMTWIQLLSVSSAFGAIWNGMGWDGMVRIVDVKVSMYLYRNVVETASVLSRLRVDVWS